MVLKWANDFFLNELLPVQRKQNLKPTIIYDLPKIGKTPFLNLTLPNTELFLVFTKLTMDFQIHAFGAISSHYLCIIKFSFMKQKQFRVTLARTTNSWF